MINNFNVVNDNTSLAFKKKFLRNKIKVKKINFRFVHVIVVLTKSKVFLRKNIKK